MTNRRSFLDCAHNNIQQFTEVCLDCGFNIYDLPQGLEQYRSTRDQAARFEKALVKEEASQPELDPLLRKSRIDSMRAQLDDLQAQLRAYEELHAGADRGGESQMQPTTVFVVYEVDGGGMGTLVNIMAIKRTRAEAEAFQRSLRHAYHTCVERQAIVAGDAVYLIDGAPTRFGIHKPR